MSIRTYEDIVLISGELTSLQLRNDFDPQNISVFTLQSTMLDLIFLTIVDRSELLFYFVSQEKILQ